MSRTNLMVSKDIPLQGNLARKIAEEIGKTVKQWVLIVFGCMVKIQNLAPSSVQLIAVGGQEQTAVSSTTHSCMWASLV